MSSYHDQRSRPHPCVGRIKNIVSTSIVGALANLSVTIVSVAQTTMEVIDGGQTVTIPGTHSSPWVLRNQNFYIGQTGSGILIVENGGAVESGDGDYSISSVGHSAGSRGEVTVTGSGSKWIDQGILYLGNEGDGTLTIENGGSVESQVIHIGELPGGHGEATVTGIGSQWINSGVLSVGWGGKGVLTVSDGGAVNSLYGHMGFYAGSRGEAIVSGVGSRWDMYWLTVGFGGDGTLTVSDGAAVTSQVGYIGYSPDSRGEVTVTGTGSQWNTGTLYVGNEGDGTLMISDGGVVNAAGASIGLASDEQNGVIVTGTGSQLNVDNLSVGYFGSGSLTISNGGVVSTGNDTLIGRSSGGDGSVIVTGVGSQLKDGNVTGVGYQGNGSLIVSDGGAVSNDATEIAMDAGATGTVLVIGAGSSLTSASYIMAGTYGLGTLTVVDGGAVTTDLVMLGLDTTGTGILTIGGESGSAPIAPGTLTTNVIEFGSGDGRLVFNHTSMNYVFDATLNGGANNAAGSGTGLVGNRLVEALAGRTIFNADQGDFTGILQASGSGILQINSNFGAATANILSGGRLEGIGMVGNTTNAGTVAPGHSIGTLTVDGHYTGNGGVLEIETVLGDDTSATDRFVVTGDVSGSTDVHVINRNGLGAQTTNGIEIIQVGGASPHDAFTLVSDYTTEDGQFAVIGGAYAYTLHHNGMTDPADGNWYLRSTLQRADDEDNGEGEGDGDGDGGEDLPGGPDGPRYSASVPVYEVYPQVLQALNGVATLQQRVGNRYWKEMSTPAERNAVYVDSNGNYTVDQNGIWGRIEGAHSRFRPDVTTSSTSYDVDLYRMQAGIDGLFHDSDAGRLIGGFNVQYAHAKADISSFFGDGEISTDGYGIGGTLTWYGNNGFYVDGQAQAIWYNSDLTSLANTITRPGLANSNNGFGYALSLESGKRIEFGNGWSVTPQAQLVYSSVDFDSFSDGYGTPVSLDRGNSLQGRLGVSLDKQASWTDDNGQITRSHLYGIANLYNEFLDGSRVNVAGVSFDSRNERLWGGLGLGGSYNWANDKYSFYGEGSVNTSLTSFADSYTVKGTVGFRVRF